MPGQSDDPRVIRAVAVHADDVVTALEATERGREAVLRITAPFAGRVRARLHVVQAIGTGRRRTRRFRADSNFAGETGYCGRAVVSAGR